MEPEVTYMGALSMQVCIPVNWTDEQVKAFAEQEFPCGTANGWSIRKEGSEYLQGAPERNPCADRKGFVHVVLEA